ncbi:MAG: hypothetical protein MZU97_10130 [Bacillus subtilis]|nr:hypothetical protein [Bacillus subtilis]
MTVFFGGMFQAVVISSERVPFKKFWRTLLILPWAVPALISQMAFSIIFSERGVVNALLRSSGVYDTMTRWGMLGNAWSESPCRPGRSSSGSARTTSSGSTTRTTSGSSASS